ncbi:hypothetical protein C7B80_16900 [Cyanosarcina cf. burmensis CCALA 770]|nr:hypothetical protein C7B80_16900 [Cyanosarcina cf. burmensis CCALA 770]
MGDNHITHFAKTVLKPPYSAVTQYIRCHPRKGIVRKLASFCEWYLNVYWNERYYKMENNGELLLIEKVITYFADAEKLNIFDVGANFGSWAQNTIGMANNLEIHCFEIIPDIALQLYRKFEKSHNITINTFGLSDQNDEIDVHFFPDSLTEGRIHSKRKDMRCEIIRGHVIRGDEYITKNQIAYIHLAKIDTEGHEKFVIDGLQGALDNEMVGVIQFEYGTTYLGSRSQLGDIYEILELKGFRIGRLFPGGVWFKDYNFPHDEHFRMGNYVAVHKVHELLINELSIKD